MDFKKSFNELKKPIVWLHYALGTAGIIAVFWLLMKYDLVKADSSIMTYALVFFGTYVIIDRVSHGILELF
jgi:hypothetical protein